MIPQDIVKKIENYCNSSPSRASNFGQVYSAAEFGYSLASPKQDAVGFAEWIEGCMYSRMYDEAEKKYIEWTDGNEIIAKTTEELYEIYKPIQSPKQDEQDELLGKLIEEVKQLNWYEESEQEKAHEEKLQKIKNQFTITRNPIK